MVSSVWRGRLCLRLLLFSEFSIQAAACIVFAEYAGMSCSGTNRGSKLNCATSCRQECITIGLEAWTNEPYAL
jgi:hypothetical protein